MDLLKQALEDEQVILDIRSQDLNSIFHEAIQISVQRQWIPAELAETVEQALLEREQTAPTAIGHSVSIPHAYLEGFREPRVIFARLAHAVNLGAPDGIPTRFIFFMLGPPGDAARHLDTLASIARLMSDDEFRFDAIRAHTYTDLTAALDRYLRRTSQSVEVVSEAIDGLDYTGRFGGGLLADIRRKAACYRSDFTDALHQKSVGSALFLFFALFTPTITFGAILAVQTNNQIGVIQMIIATAVCGVIFAFFSGQPLIVLGHTGPLLVMTVILYKLCEQNGIEFLPAYCWVGLWTALFLMILSLTEVCCLMRYFTRFTDEIFVVLISFIFIYEALRWLFSVFERVNVGPYDTALFSLVLTLGTFFIASSLSRMRRSRLLRSNFREFISDFGPTIAVLIMTVTALFFRGIDLDKLNVTDALVDSQQRPWVIPFWSVPLWLPFAAIGPALLVTVLIYLEENIAARLVNSPDHNLKKGGGYHLDLAVVSVLTCICSLFGMPWLVAATVRSLNHVRSLATTEVVVKPDGYKHERVLHVRENRLTGLVTVVFIGSTLLFLPFMKVIPLAVLYGLFLFMGVVSLVSNQFFERLSLWLIDPGLYPSTHYLRRVPIATVHKYTLLQLICLAVLWIVKTSFLGLLFPLFIAGLIPIRLLAGRFFSAEDLEALDAAEEPEEEETHWAA
ncbi:MAG: PTS sugar transporter subunit IIA [Planctomycetota bacterium]|nr:PTS sugar transporter subunit IIA [Planctomycetota bacterium]MEC8338398.1 PTS sugar transporter subunit IIA [Planctomycetota bacterium]